VRADNPLSEWVWVTASDEAFAIMCIKRNIHEWIKQYENVDKKKASPSRRTKTSPSSPTKYSIPRKR
jgi:hypothetical protein